MALTVGRGRESVTAGPLGTGKTTTLRAIMGLSPGASDSVPVRARELI